MPETEWKIKIKQPSLLKGGGKFWVDDTVPEKKLVL
jgi:hypothetical protein